MIKRNKLVNDVLFVGRCQSKSCFLPKNDQNPTDTDIASPLPPHYLWKCSENEVTASHKVCDYRFDCLKHEDETDGVRDDSK